MPRDVDQSGCLFGCGFILIEAVAPASRSKTSKKGSEESSGATATPHEAASRLSAAGLTKEAA
jgi:hypothetical protein